MSGHPTRVLWSGRHLTWHINCLEMLAMFRALKHFLPDLRNRPVLVHTDNTAVVFYINHQGVCVRAPCTSWCTRSSRWEQFIFLGIWIWEQISCRGRGWGTGNGCFTPRWSRYGEFWARLRWICLRLVRHCTVRSGSFWLLQLCWGWMLWYRLGRGFVCTPLLYTIALLTGVLERLCRDGVHLLLYLHSGQAEYGSRTWFLSSTALHGGFPSGGISSHRWRAWSFTPGHSSVWYSAGVRAGQFLRRVNPLHPEGLRGGYSGLPHPFWWPFNRQEPSSYTFPPVHWGSGLWPEKLMLSGGSGCYHINSSPLISPRLWGSRLTQLKYGGLQGLSGRCTYAGHRRRCRMVYTPHIMSGSMIYNCEPPLALLFSWHTCAFPH